MKFHGLLLNSDESLKACSWIFLLLAVLPISSSLSVIKLCKLGFLKIFANQNGAYLPTQQTTSEFHLEIKGVRGNSPTVDTSFLKLLVLC